MAKNKREPKLPNLPKKNKKPKFYKVETEYFEVDFISKNVYQQCLKHCNNIGIEFNYYMFEFNIHDENLVN